MSKQTSDGVPFLPRQALHHDGVRVSGAFDAAFPGHRLTAHYQPIVSLADGRVVGLEALARLVDREGRVVMPADFLPQTEASGLIGDLGAKILSLAVEAAAGWRRIPQWATTTVSVNVAPAQLSDPDFPEAVRRAVNDHDLPASSLVLEITENAAVADGVLPVLSRLASLGFRLALDDFGMGFANLDHLRRLPAHVLKLDRSFVSGVASTGPDRSIVRVAIDLATSLGMTLIAEGVEEETQASVLEDLGCGLAQGYLFARPGPDPVAAARSVPARTRVRLIEPVHLAVWDRDNEDRVLAAAALVAPDRDLRLGAAFHLANRIAAAGDHEPAVSFLAPRLALILDALPAVLALPLGCSLNELPGIRAVGSGTSNPDPVERTSVDIAALALRVADSAELDGSVEDCDRMAAACARAAGEAGPFGNELRVAAGGAFDVAGTSEVLRDLSARRVRGNGNRDGLRCLVGLSRAMGSPSDPREVLRVALEEARRIVGAAAASLERWHKATGVIQTLINVGDLGRGDETFPAAEVYDASDFGGALNTMRNGVPGLIRRHTAVVDPEGIVLLDRLGKGSSANVALTVGNEIWGQLYFSTGPNDPEFSGRDVELLVSVATLMSGLVAQAAALEGSTRSQITAR